MPFVKIYIDKNTSKKSKKNLHVLCVKKIIETPFISKDSIFITIAENSQDNCSFDNAISQLME